ncbi:DNA-binding transcriptional regulator, AcrR family [Nocardioides scoriae]|uniref:DNA-binding transcriptional regulator, AcrR family n=1 Tax=Nocardioides scoriae TaxID=642780 RepID=A0A1H1SA00_9ACTN|nr:TetR/AcrR family transcriptional regulator [Nocardioides scoriae]SDS44713.1 DNA-binding transcriptional regulator, AcrR family [Nocardioides scoriae]
MTPRATPMAPEERRAAIVSAVAPLVLEHGRMPSTREIAQAAGIAEGTIYRVFEDKGALLHAVLEEVLRPPDTADQLVGLMASLPGLATRLLVLAERSQARMREVHATMMVMRPLMEQAAHGRGAPLGPPRFLVEANEALMERLTRVFELSADELRVEPLVAAAAFRALMLGAHSPGMPSPSPLTPEVVTRLLLEGFARPDSRQEGDA